MKPATDREIEDARSKYQNSTQEKCDVKRAFIASNGSMTHMLNNLPFMRAEDEKRIIKIIGELISKGEVPNKKIKKIRIN